MNLAIKKDTTTTLVVNMSTKASNEEAFRAEESILSPMNLLNLISHILNIIDIKRSTKGTHSKITGSGLIIL
ncbi:hypothetical protein bsdtw1_00201 [Clostridium fungisolvens]|uniref:Uncharacterized protein n=1 Tax=Clostridium fungisolvens TaxID=1604897 RepID=A0A6V8SBS8_9CLOT|nr:hypothetical protein bsdtw1_00201 [Clostridium fungisolvens]